MNFYSHERTMEMNNQKVVLAYSGGLDTSVAIKWLQDQRVRSCGIFAWMSVKGKIWTSLKKKRSQLVQ